jgi:hypothetical protein
MPKKKVTKKAEAKKVHEMDLSKPFDLSDTSRETLEGYASFLKAMIASAGWKLMEQVLEGNKSVLEKQIVLKTDGYSGTVLSNEEIDELRIQHAQISQLLRMPHSLIKQYSQDEQPKAGIEYDPYSSSTGSEELVVNAAVMSDTT